MESVCCLDVVAASHLASGAREVVLSAGPSSRIMMRGLSLLAYQLEMVVVTVASVVW